MVPKPENNRKDILNRELLMCANCPTYEYNIQTRNNFILRQHTKRNIGPFRQPQTFGISTQNYYGRR